MNGWRLCCTVSFLLLPRKRSECASRKWQNDNEQRGGEETCRCCVGGIGWMKYATNTRMNYAILKWAREGWNSRWIDVFF